MRLTKQTGHAIRILTDCARLDGQLLKAADISERLGITKQNVFKIVHLLSRAGFVTPVRGPNGGVRLAEPAHCIRIGDVVRALEVTDVEVDSHAATGSPSRKSAAAISAIFDDAMTAFVAVLDQHTLADLAAAQSRKPQSGTIKSPAAHKAAARKSARR